MGSNRLAHREQRTRRGSADDKPSPYITPEIRLTREASLGWGESDGLDSDWSRYLNSIGKANKQLGNARAFGSLALTYVSAQDFGIMLAKKHPDLYEPGNAPHARKRLIKVQRSYATAFNKRTRFWRENDIVLPLESIKPRSEPLIEQVLADTEFEVLHELEDNPADVDQDSIDNYEEVLPDHAYDLANSVLWAEGGFLTNDTRPIGGKMKAGETRTTKRAIDLSRNPELIDEWNTIHTWLKDNEFDTRFMGDFTPHVTFFDGIHNLTQFALKSAVKIPDEIGLEKPRIVTNHEEIKAATKTNR